MARPRSPKIAAAKKAIIEAMRADPNLSASKAFEDQGLSRTRSSEFKKADPEFKKAYEEIMASRTPAQRGKIAPGEVCNPKGTGAVERRRKENAREVGMAQLLEIREATMDPSSPLFVGRWKDLCDPAKQGQKAADENYKIFYTKFVHHAIIKDKITEASHSHTHSVDTSSVDEMMRKNAQLDKTTAPLIEAYNSTLAIKKKTAIEVEHVSLD